MENPIITPTIPPATLNIHFHCTNEMNGSSIIKIYLQNIDRGVEGKEPCDSNSNCELFLPFKLYTQLLLLFNSKPNEKIA